MCFEYSGEAGCCGWCWGSKGEPRGSLSDGEAEIRDSQKEVCNYNYKCAVTSVQLQYVIVQLQMKERGRNAA